MNNKPDAVEVGYLCSHGHYQFHGVGDDTCGTKRIATLMVVPEEGVEFYEASLETDEEGFTYFTSSGYTQDDWDETLEAATISQQRREAAWEKS